MKSSSKKKRCPNGTYRDKKTNRCITKNKLRSKSKKKIVSKKVVSKTISYDFDGGIKTETLKFPKVTLTYIAPANSEGIFDENFEGLDFENSDLSYSHFTNCNFRNTNMKGVNMDNSRFQGCIFIKTTGLTNKHKNIIRSTGGILNEKDLALFKKQQREYTNMAKKFNKLKKEALDLKDRLLESSQKNPMHGDICYVTNKYKLYTF